MEGEKSFTRKSASRQSSERRRSNTGKSSLADSQTNESQAEYVPRSTFNKTLNENAEIVFQTNSLALLRSKGKLLAQAGNDSINMSNDGYKGKRLTQTENDSIKGSDKSYVIKHLAQTENDSMDGSINRSDEACMDRDSKVVSFMKQMFRQSKICDVKLRADGKVLYAHKLALGAYSAKLARKFSEFAPGEIVSVDISEYHYSVVEVILDFVYSFEIRLDENNIMEVYACSVELGIDMLVALCLKYLANINIDNWFKLLPVAEKFRLKDIVEQIMGFVCKNFPAIVKTSGFLGLPYHILLTIVSRDDLRVLTELEVFLAVVSWVDYNRAERLAHAPSLMRCVRFPLIQPEDLATRVEPVHHIFDNQQCFEMLYNAMRFHALRYSNSPAGQKLSVPRSRPR